MTHHRSSVRRFGLVTIVTATTVALLLPFMAGRANAQPGTGVRCDTQVTFENRIRRVFGTNIAVDCGFPDELHTAPFGNWGVQSNGGSRWDGFQFAGWKRGGGLLQWNSCTTLYPPPHPDHYNDNGNATQKANPDNVRAYAQRTESGSLGVTCESEGGVFTERNNYMEFWELDPWWLLPFEDDDRVAELRYPSASIPLTCWSEWECEGASDWLSPVGGDGISVVSAEIRISVVKYQVICESPETGECF